MHAHSRRIHLQVICKSVSHQHTVRVVIVCHSPFPSTPSLTFSFSPQRWLRSAPNVELSNGAHRSVNDLLSSLRPDKKSMNIYIYIYNIIEYICCLNDRGTMWRAIISYPSAGLSSRPSPPPLQKKGPLYPRRSCPGRRGGPGPFSGQLEIQSNKKNTQRSV